MMVWSFVTWAACTTSVFQKFPRQRAKQRSRRSSGVQAKRRDGLACRCTECRNPAQTCLGEPAEETGELAVGQRGAARAELRLRQRDGCLLHRGVRRSSSLKGVSDHAQRPRRHPQPDALTHGSELRHRLPTHIAATHAAGAQTTGADTPVRTRAADLEQQHVAF
eukprot:380372-Rhodomonas_salina.5